MSKPLFALPVIGALLGAAGIGFSIWGAVEADKEHKQIPEIREVVKQDYENGNIDLDQYTAKMEEFVRKDAELPVMEGLFITNSVISAMAAGVFTWLAVEESRRF